jgi:aryl carrier-like protein
LRRLLAFDRAGFGSLAVVACLASPADAASRDRVYTVANYPVDAVAANAVAAKEKAHADGQQAAFGALLKRLVPVTSYPQLARLSSVQAATFADGIAIRSETNSRTEYIANLDFSFQADAVRGLLSREGVPFVEEQAAKAVIVPVMAQSESSGGQQFRPGGATWTNAWKGLDLDNSLTPLKIEQLLPSIQDATINAALAGDDQSERILTTEYKADFVLFAVAEIDESNKQLNVTLAGIDGAGLLSWRRSYRVSGGDVDYAMQLAAVVTQGVLEGRWKVAKLEENGARTGSYTGPGSFGSGSVVQMAVEFSNPQEWDDLRRQILDVPGIDDVRIGSVSSTWADVSVRYPGGGPGLAAVLAQHGLSLSATGETWSLRSGY